MPDHDVTAEDLAQEAADALQRFDYDRARTLLERALELTKHAAPHARALLEILVETLGADADAVELGGRLPPQTLRDRVVRGLLGLAAARMGDRSGALAWLERAEGEPAAVGLALCAQSALADDQTEAAEELAARARLICPTDSTVLEAARALGEVHQMDLLEKEEALAEHLASGRMQEAERVAQELVARQPRNEPAAAALRRIATERADAHARLVLARPPAARLPEVCRAHAAALRAAAVAAVSTGVRDELEREAQHWEDEAQTAEDSDALRQFNEVARQADRSLAALAGAYFALREPLRAEVRRAAGSETLGWIEQVGGEHPAARDGAVAAVEALVHALSLADDDPEAALSVLVPRMRDLGGVPRAVALRAELEPRASARRGARVTEVLREAEQRLAAGDPDAAARMLAEVADEAVPGEVAKRVACLRVQADAARAARRVRQTAQTLCSRGRLFEARESLDELLRPDGLDQDARDDVEQERSAITSAIRQRFGCLRVPEIRGNWWRHYAATSTVVCSACPWICVELGVAFVPGTVGDRLLLVEISLRTGQTVGAWLLRLPQSLEIGPQARVVGTRLLLTGNDGEILELDVRTMDVLAWEGARSTETKAVEVAVSSRDPDRLWMSVRPQGPSRTEAEEVFVVDRRTDRASRVIARDASVIPVLGHPEVDVIVGRDGRLAALDPRGRKLRAWRMPWNVSAGVAHPTGDGLVLASVDYDGEGQLTLSEVFPERALRACELEEFSGEARHWLGASRTQRLVALHGYEDIPVINAFEASATGLTRVWTHPCHQETVLLTDWDCSVLYVLLTRPDGRWMAELALTPPTWREPRSEDGCAPPEHALEIWRCHGLEISFLPAANGLAITGPERNHPGTLLDRCVRADPRDTVGLGRILAAISREESGHDRAAVEINRLLGQFPGSSSVRYVAAQARAEDLEWGDVHRLLRDVEPDDVGSDCARHLCHLQALCRMQARDFRAARDWCERGEAHPGSCDLAALAEAASPLTEVSESHASYMTALRRRLAGLDAQLATSPGEVLRDDETEPCVGRIPAQVRARRVRAWLELQDDDPESLARKTLELAAYVSVRREPDSLRIEVPFPESWPEAELRALQERAECWLEADAGSRECSSTDIDPLLPHELVRTLRPGFEDLVEGLVRRLVPGRPALDAACVTEREVLADPEVRAFLVREVQNELRRGRLRREAHVSMQRLAALLLPSTNHRVHLRKTFWVDAELSWLLQHTHLDIRGEYLQLPFLCCAFVFTDTAALELCAEVLTQDVRWPRGARPKLLAVYLWRTEPGVEPAILHVRLACVASREELPTVLARELRVTPTADLDAIVDSHLRDAIERRLEPWLDTEALRRLLHLTLNAVLYTTSAGVDWRSHESEPRTRRSQPPQTLVGDTVFFLPGKIEIRAGANADRPVDAHDALPGRIVARRVPVRGYWRRPPATSDEQRLRWVRPHFRGPDMAVLVERAYSLKA